MNITSNNRVQGTLHKVSGPLTRDVRRKEIMKPILTLVILCAVSLSALADDIESNAFLDVQHALKSAREYVQDGAITYFSAPLTWTNLDFISLTYNFDSPNRPITLIATIISSVQSNAVSTNITDIKSDKLTIYLDNFGIMVGNAISLGHTGHLFSAPGPDGPNDVIPPPIFFDEELESAQQSVAGSPPQCVGSPEP